MKLQTVFELTLSLILASLFVLACGDDDDDNTDTNDTDTSDTGTETDTNTGDTDSATDTNLNPDAGSDSGTLGGFGDPCTDNVNCESGVCHEFGQLGFVCTLTCENNDQCPEGSEGKKCNTQNVCRP